MSIHTFSPLHPRSSHPALLLRVGTQGMCPPSFPPSDYALRARLTPAPSLRPEQGRGWASGADGHSTFMISSEGINSIFGSPHSGLKLQGGKVRLCSSRQATLVDTRTLLDLGDIMLYFLEQGEWIPSGPNSCLLA